MTIRMPFLEQQLTAKMSHRCKSAPPLECVEMQETEFNGPCVRRRSTKKTERLSRYNEKITTSEQDLFNGLEKVLEHQNINISNDGEPDKALAIRNHAAPTVKPKARTILQEFRPLFIASLDTPDIVDCLIAKGLLSEDDSETISIAGTRKCRVRALLNILDSRGPCAESTFLQALQSRSEFNHVWVGIQKDKGIAEEPDPAVPNLKGLSKIYKSTPDVNQLLGESFESESSQLRHHGKTGICSNCQSTVNLEQLVTSQEEIPDQDLNIFPGYISTDMMSVGDIYDFPKYTKVPFHISTKTVVVPIDGPQFTATWTCPVDLNDVLEFLRLPVGVTLQIVGGKRTEGRIDQYLVDVMRRPDDGQHELLILIKHKKHVEELDLDHQQNDIRDITEGSHVVYQVTWGHVCLLSYRLTYQAFRKLQKIFMRKSQSVGPCCLDEMSAFIDELMSVTSEGQCYMFCGGNATDHEITFLDAKDLTLFYNIPETAIEYILKPVFDPDSPTSPKTPYLKEALATLTELLDAKRHLVDSMENSTLKGGMEHSHLLEELYTFLAGFTEAINCIEVPSNISRAIKKCQNFRKSELSVYRYTQTFITAYEKACEDVTKSVERQCFDPPVRLSSRRGNNDIFIIITGPRGQGKSATANTLVGKPVFVERRHSVGALNVRRSSWSSRSDDAYLAVVSLPDGRTLHVLDTEYLALDQKGTRHLAEVELVRAFFLFHQGIDAFVDVHNSTTFFRDPSLNSLLNPFEDTDIQHHTILLLTFADTHFQDSSIREDVDTLEGETRRKVLRRQKRVLCFENRPSSQHKVQLGHEQLSFDLGELKRSLQAEQFMYMLDTIGEVYRNRFIDTARELYENMEKQIERRVDCEWHKKKLKLAESLTLLRKCVKEVGYTGSNMEVLRRNLLATQSEMLRGNNMATMCVHHDNILERTLILCEAENELLTRFPVTETSQGIRRKENNLKTLMRSRSLSSGSIQRHVREIDPDLEEERRGAEVHFQSEVNQLYHEYSHELKEQLRRSYQQMKVVVEAHIANLSPELLTELLNAKESPWSLLHTFPRQLQLEAGCLVPEVVRSQLQEPFFGMADLDVQTEVTYILSLYCEQLLTLRRQLGTRPSLISRVLCRSGLSR